MLIQHLSEDPSSTHPHAYPTPIQAPIQRSSKCLSNTHPRNPSNTHPALVHHSSNTNPTTCLQPIQHASNTHPRPIPGSSKTCLQRPIPHLSTTHLTPIRMIHSGSASECFKSRCPYCCPRGSGFFWCCSDERSVLRKATRAVA